MGGEETEVLRRTLGRASMVMFGLGTIIGAGIYVLVGAVAARAGSWTPLSFVAAAAVAALTGLSYSELVARHPRSAGEAVYVDAAFGREWLTRTVGWGVVLTGMISAATLASGFSGYLGELVAWPQWLSIVLLVVAVAVLASVGVRESVGTAVVVTAVEIVGLALVVAASWGRWTQPARWADWAAGLAQPQWLGIAAGAFIAFYAFIGFEDMVNMAEEVRNPGRTLPRAIITAIAVSTGVYLVVSLVAVVAVTPGALAGSAAPLTVIVGGSSWLPPSAITLISLFAIVNGVVVQFLMGPRVMYGMSSGGGAPRLLGFVDPRTRTPLAATAIFAGLVLVAALALPLDRLAQLTSAVILLVFLAVNAALIRLRRSEPNSGFRVPASIPYLAAASCALLLMAQVGLWIAG